MDKIVVVFSFYFKKILFNVKELEVFVYDTDIFKSIYTMIISRIYFFGIIM